MKNFLILITVIFALSFNVFSQQKSFHDFEVKNIDGEKIDLSKFKGKKLLVVNTASKCGLTPQYKILQSLYKKYSDKFEIIAFPANNFLKQEPGTSEEIKEFCQKNYGVTFPIMEKVSVSNYIYLGYPPNKEKSEKTEKSDIYKWLTEKSENGVMDTEIKWNFHKFLIDEKGNLIGSLPSQVAMEIEYILGWILE